MKVELLREPGSEKQVLGELRVLDESGGELYHCKTLELPWKENRRRISCIPPGTYRVKKRWSPRFRHHFHVFDVPNRTWILIHHGNFYTNTKGCILVGREHTDIDGDGLRDVIVSKKTMQELLDLLPDRFEMTIK
ncbi:MAG: hypothetical protein KAW12_23175 [Candidatus Aminicenantes bacterium]|nr:hypothetical protein [Candidatus Aminicenantes bacterium]